MGIYIFQIRSGNTPLQNEVQYFLPNYWDDKEN